MDKYKSGAAFVTMNFLVGSFSYATSQAVFGDLFRSVVATITIAIGHYALWVRQFRKADL